MSLTRRQVLGAALIAPALPALSAARTAPEAPRLVLVIARGAMDGLALVVPHGDPAYSNARGALALPPPNEGGDGTSSLALDSTFALHPALSKLHGRFRTGELLPVHAVGTSYRDRSHFDAQTVLESGHAQPTSSSDGWLNRTLAHLPLNVGNTGAVAIASAMPLVLRGKQAASTYNLGNLPDPDDATMARVARLYAADTILSERLERAIATANTAGAKSNNKRGKNALQWQIDAAARLLTLADGPRIAVLEANGWDTHAGQGAATGTLANRFRQLDAALEHLANSLAPVWAQTVVMLVSEFGRTVKVNGSAGTDHGTGAAALLLGGAVRGGRVHADWPGLGDRSLHEARDLHPTTDLRSVFKAVLAGHMGVSEAALERDVFPDSGSAPALHDLLRDIG